MKKILTLFLFFVSLAFFGGVTLAQGTDGEIAAKYGVTFPISELGSCENLYECRTFCEDPINQDACVSFAKSKGFYNEEDFEVDDSVVRRAGTVLGCNSLSSCRDFCESEENFDKCHRFAQGSGLVGGYTRNPESGEFLDKAKDVLGCTSYDNCRNFCKNPTNHDKCSQFAGEVGARGGYEYRGPGGCTTETSCRTFCQLPENTEDCRQFAQSSSSQSNYDPQVECKKHPSCSWAGNYCQCSNQSQTDPGSIERNRTLCTSYSGCTWTGNACQCSGSGSPSGGGGNNYPNISRESQESACKAGGGTCNWNGDTCACTGYNSTSGGSGGANPPSQSEQEVACRSGGGVCVSWVNGACGCERLGVTSTQPPTSSQPQYDDPASACASAGCSWNGSACQCSSVQGVTTAFINSWWQKLLDLIW